MASIQARHSRQCKIGRPWTTFADAAKAKGCTCVPLYHVVHRHDGKLVRDPVGHNRKEAKRALDARRGDIARRDYHVLRDIRFDEWADQWLAAFTGKQNSRRVYKTTLDYAKATFGTKKVRDLHVSDLRRFLDRIQDTALERQVRTADEKRKPASPATLAKHLRQLNACLSAAVAEGYATLVPKLHRTARPKVAKSRPSYFTDDELARLWPELVGRAVYLALCKVSVATGMRFGELAALRWTDVDLLAREVHISRTYVVGIGETTPKSGEARTVDLTPQAAAILEQWYAESGGDGLVFEREEGGYLDPSYVTRGVLYPAMRRAGISRIGERGRARTFHSFRHSFARIALERGAEITWVRGQVGHSSIHLTVDVYGHWARASEKAQAKKLEGVFPV